VSAAQFTSTNDLDARGLMAWMASATRPFPDPLSPRRSAVVFSLLASSSICSTRSRIAGDEPRSATVGVLPRRSAR
jgi:hypothetical protein